MEGLETVDRIEVQVLVDNVTDSLSSVPGFVTQEWIRLRRMGMRRTEGSCLCCANHGLSLVVTAWRGEARRTLMFDAGPEAYAVERNGTRLGVAFGDIDGVVLSHGHWDHAGGLLQAFRMMRAANGGRPVPIWLHPGMFFERASRLPGGGVFPMQNVPTPDELAAEGAAPVVTDRPAAVLDGMFFVSGEIPRVTPYEVGLPGQVRRTAADAPWEPDELLMDERFVAVRIRDKGIAVFSACSHAGVVNVLTNARDCFPGERLYAVMGGFHLSGTNERVIPDTVRDMGAFDLEVIAAAHCTGWRAVNALERAYGSRVVPAAVGKLFAF